MHQLTNNDHLMKDRRKELRARSTDAERLLWQKLRGRQLADLKFFRQFSVGSFILDFYCPKIKLAIELDGSQHGTEQGVVYDQERTAYLEGKGIKVVRFWNNEVLTNIEGVMAKISDLVLTPPTPLKQEEGLTPPASSYFARGGSDLTPSNSLLNKREDRTLSCLREGRVS